MMKFFINIFFIVIFSFQANSEIINKIEIEGNNRISNSNIILFGKINLNEDYDNNQINKILKNLYQTDFFKTINISIKNNTLIVKVLENPIVQTIEITGVKSLLTTFIKFSSFTHPHNRCTLWTLNIFLFTKGPKGT